MTRRRQRVPSTTPEPEITAEALEALGTERLAAILLTHAEWDDALSQTLRLAIAASSTSTNASNTAGSGGGLARTLSAEIARIAKDDRFYGYRDGRILAAELDRVRQSIMEDLLPVQPRAAAGLLARFILLDGNVFERSDDSDGIIGDVIREAVEDYGTAWAAVPDRDPAALAREVFATFTKDDYGVHGEIINAFADALGADGLDELERLFREGLAYRDAKNGGRNERMLSRGLKDIADARGDVDAYVEAQRITGTENFALEDICLRLINAGRYEEALNRIETTVGLPHRRGEIEALRVEILDHLGRHDEAQRIRWNEFTRTLSRSLLDDFTNRLPREQRQTASAHAAETALAHHDGLGALSLLAESDIDAAARLVLSRQEEMNGNLYTIL
jgi:hypothetical protein